MNIEEWFCFICFICFTLQADLSSICEYKEACGIALFGFWCLVEIDVVLGQFLQCKED